MFCEKYDGCAKESLVLLKLPSGEQTMKKYSVLEWNQGFKYGVYVLEDNKK